VSSVLTAKRIQKPNQRPVFVLHPLGASGGQSGWPLVAQFSGVAAADKKRELCGRHAPNNKSDQQRRSSVAFGAYLQQPNMRLCKFQLDLLSDNAAAEHDSQ